MLKPPPAPALKPPLDASRDHILGSATAPIELVEYGDFECPHCGRAFGIVQQLRETFGNQLRFAYRHFPLAKMHPHARTAAMSAEAAGAQGKFWEMHDILFRHGSALEMGNVTRYAEEVGVPDIARFTADVSSEKFGPRVQEDLASGVRSGVNGTPTFFLNGKRYNGGYDYDSMKDAIEAL
jgi:NhaA family Na+:H+ antiporter